MDRAALIHKRKKRYMAQLLDQFDRELFPLLPPDRADAFKGEVRRKFQAIALDAIEISGLPSDTEVNGAAEDLRDQVSRSSEPQRSTAA